MLFYNNNFHKVYCINGCELFEDNKNYSYWESNFVTSDEEEIADFLNSSELSKNKNILHIGIGNSFLANNLNNYKSIDGITISNNELSNGQNLKLPNYNIFFKNKYSKGDLIKDKINYYDLIIDNNLKSFACCEYSFEDLIIKYKKYLKNGGYIISSLKGMSWSRIVKPVYSFSLKKFFYKRLKEFDGPKTNLMSFNDCQKLSSKHNFTLDSKVNNLIFFKKNQ